MSGRHEDYKGSSRSTRDDSRQYKDCRSRREHDRRRSKSRSRSPRRRASPPRNNKYPPAKSSKYSPPSNSHSEQRDERKYEDKKSHRKSPTNWDSSEEEEVPAPPPPPRITPISIELAKPKGPIKMNLAGPAKSVTKKPLVASVFNDDDDEPEEMPAEARMRMRNIGRETPTSAGPNSFGKTKQGFCDAKKVFEKNLKEALECPNKSAGPKFPQTIYKIKGP